MIAGLAYGVYYFLKGRSNQDVVENYTKEGFEITQGSDNKKVSYIADPLQVNFGVTLYPGSKKSERQSADIDTNGNKRTIGVFTSSDSVEKVIEYFQKQIGSDVQTNKAIQGGINYTVITKKVVLDPIISVFKDGSTTTYMVIKK